MWFMKKQNNLCAENLLLFCHVYLAVLIIAVVGVLVVKFLNHYQAANDQARDYAIEILVNLKRENLDNILREKREWMIYIISVLMVTMVSFFSLFFWQKKCANYLKSERCLDLYRVVVVLTIPLFLAFLYFAFAPSYHILDLPQKREIYTSPLAIIFSIMLVIAAICYQVLASDYWQRITKIISGLFVFFVSLWIVSYGVFDQSSMALEPYAINFNPVVEPIIQQYLGAELLVDFKSYYGLYPYLLQIFLHIFPATILTLSIVLALFFLIVLFCLAFAIFSVVENKFVALLGFIALIFVQNFTNNWWPLESAVSFQYESIRLLFPSLILLLLHSFCRQQSVKKYYFILFLSALALLWNLDSGVPIFVTSAVILGHEALKNNFCWKKLFMHLAKCVGALSFAIILLALFVKIDSGKWFNLSWIFYGQKAAAEHAIAMLPCDAAGLWYVVVLIYIVGLVLSINNFVTKKHSLQNSMMLAFTILGVGLLTYFIGRGHEVNLMHCCFPAVILLTIFADKFCRNSALLQKRKANLDLVIFISPLFLVSYLTSVFFFNLPTHPSLQEKLITEKFSAKSRELTPYWIKEAEFIRRNISFDGKVRDDILLLTTNDQDFYFDLEFKIKSSLQIRDFRQTHYQKDLDAVYDLIKSRKKQFVIFVFSQKKEVIKSASDDEISNLFKILEKDYNLESQLQIGADDAVYIYQMR